MAEWWVGSSVHKMVDLMVGSMAEMKSQLRVVKLAVRKVH